VLVLPGSGSLELLLEPDSDSEIVVPRPLAPSVRLFEGPGVTPLNVNNLSLMFQSSMTANGTPGLEQSLYKLYMKPDTKNPVVGGR
jgi:hypothetical protein